MDAPEAAEVVVPDEDENEVVLLRVEHGEWVFTAGHHEGQKLSEVPTSYIEWLDRPMGPTSNWDCCPLTGEILARGWPWGVECHGAEKMSDYREAEACPCGRSLLAEDTLWYIADEDNLCIGLRGRAICPSCGWHWCCEECGWVEKRAFM
jgi:hypothetical protein